MTETIDYTPPPTIRAFIKTYRPGALFMDWVVGPVGCLPCDSEFLTPTGWKRMDTYTPGDKVAVWTEGRVSFEEAEYVRLPATEPFHVMDSGSLVMELSPEHRVLYQDYRGEWQVAAAEQVVRRPSRRTIPTTWQTPNETNLPWTEAQIRLAVAFAADGHIPNAGKKVRVVLRKERKKVRLRALLAGAGIDWTEATCASRPTETGFSFEYSAAAKNLDFVWRCDSDQLEVVLDECLRWDGLNEHAEKRFYTTKKAEADAIQYAAHATGRRATIHAYDDMRNADWATTYTVAIRTGDHPKNRAMVRAETRFSRRDAPDGMKYCFSTSTGFFVARCRGTVFITGNSGKTTGIFFKLAYMAKRQEPGPDGIRRSRAVVVRNTLPQLKDTTLASWFMWFRDGQAGKWEATNYKFILRFDDVECEVLFRPLDTADDIARVLSLEVTFAILDEFVQIPREIVDALSARVGRYPSKKDGGATNWGMWGASNTDTEDNWWFEYLHNEDVVYRSTGDAAVDQMKRDAAEAAGKTWPNVTYYHQPSGFSPAAENIDNLPGGRAYYTEQAKDKKPAWVKQFIDAEWGFSAAGMPVVSTYKKEWHVAKHELPFNPHLELVIGLDPGLAGMGLVMTQQDVEGRLMCLGEIGLQNVGVERMVTQHLKPYLRRRFPGAKVIIAPDPAAAQRAQTNERAVTDILKRHFEVKVETNNRLPLRLDAIDYFAARLTDAGAALVIDPLHCPKLIRALSGGWRYAMDTKRGVPKGSEPEKNEHSHIGDAFGYAARYHHKLDQRYGGDRARVVRSGGHQTIIRPAASPAYHFR